MPNELASQGLLVFSVLLYPQEHTRLRMISVASVAPQYACIHPLTLTTLKSGCRTRERHRPGESVQVSHYVSGKTSV
jgi:hypothetical protein